MTNLINKLNDKFAKEIKSFGKKILSHDYFSHFNQETFMASGIANSGKENTGFVNSGYRNSGNWNSGYRNSGKEVFSRRR
jgi:Pentapeptide repeats (8 copies)